MQNSKSLFCLERKKTAGISIICNTFEIQIIVLFVTEHVLKFSYYFFISLYQKSKYCFLPCSFIG